MRHCGLDPQSLLQDFGLGDAINRVSTVTFGCVFVISQSPFEQFDWLQILL